MINQYIRNGNKHSILRFDFYVANQYLIEFDGEQHYKSFDWFGGEEGFKDLQNRDKFKNAWCKKKNIPLIRIPYTQIDTLDINDVLLETTTFKVV